MRLDRADVRSVWLATLAAVLLTGSEASRGVGADGVSCSLLCTLILARLRFLIRPELVKPAGSGGAAGDAAEVTAR